MRSVTTYCMQNAPPPPEEEIFLNKFTNVISEKAGLPKPHGIGEKINYANEDKLDKGTPSLCLLSSYYLPSR